MKTVEEERKFDGVAWTFTSRFLPAWSRRLQRPWPRARPF
jgi:hypothetical protein